MAASRLSCPECGTVLRPAKPVAPGKKVKCPRCDTIFVAGRDEEDEDDRPRKKSASAGAGKKKAAPAAKAKAPAKKKEEEETYGYIKDDEEQDEDNKPVIDYAEDQSIKDLRSPALVKLRDPANKLQMVGFAGVIGTFIFSMLLIIPACFPISEEKKDQGFMPPSAEKKKEAARVPIYQLFGYDIYWIIELPWYLFIAAMVGLALLMAYSGAIVAGGIKMQNLESRNWGIAACVMCILPLNVVGLISVFTLAIQYLAANVLEDINYGYQVSGGLAVMLWLASAAVGGFGFRPLFDEEVLEGFAYDPE